MISTRARSGSWPATPASRSRSPRSASADLWPGQLSENELGFDYPTADEILYLLFDQGLSGEEVIDRGYWPDPSERSSAWSATTASSVG
ncbi:MAG: hypothetical protein R2862_09120 [Thermoanaerobaculia bacterium]